MARVLRSSSSREKHFLKVVRLEFAKSRVEGYKRVLIADIIQSVTPMDIANCYVQGKVVQAFPCMRTKTGWSRKLLLQDERSDSTDTRDALAIIFRAPQEQEFSEVKVKDTFIIRGATLEVCPAERYQINADSSNHRMKIWLIKAANVQSNQEVGIQRNLNLGADSATAANQLSTIKLIPGQLPCVVPVFTKLADLRRGVTVNLYGVVKFFKSPFQTRGSDWCSTLRIVDPSIRSINHALNCVFFSKSVERLPQIQASGDVVRLLNVEVGNFGSELQGKVTPHFTWLVFDGTPGASFQPITHSPGSYTVTNSDQTKIQQLRAWGVQHKELRPNLHISTMAELSAGNKFLNFTCQITAIAMTTDRNSFVLTVCDGTTPCCPVVLPEKVDVASRVSCDGNTCGRAAGRTVNILLHGSHRRKVAELQPADFVLLNNVHVYLSASATGQNDALEASNTNAVTLTIHQGTSLGRGVHKLGPNDPRFTALKQRLDELPETDVEQRQDTPSFTQQEGDEITTASVNDDLNARALQTSCTVTEHPTIPFTSLKDIASSSSIPAKFRCRVKAQAFMPDSLEHIVQNCCHLCELVLPGHCTGVGCPNCGQVASPEYLFSLMLEDGTGVLHAMLFSQDALKFLPGLPSPIEYLRDTCHQENVKHIVKSLTDGPGIGEVTNNEGMGGGLDTERPWLECCIMKYCGQKDGSPRAQYRIFDTTCILE